MAKADRIPDGFALIRLTDLAALLAARAPGPTSCDGGPCEGLHPEPQRTRQSASWPALAATVGVLTARLNGDVEVTAADLAPDVPPAAVTAAALVLAAGTLSVFLPDQGRPLLRDLGLLAASEGGPDADD